MKKPIRIVLVDDHLLFRQGLRALLKAIPDVEVMFEAENGKALIAQLEDRRPDIVLLDLEMEEMNGVDTLATVLEMYPDLKIIVLTMHKDAHIITHLMAAGAKGYLLKNTNTGELEQALRTVMEGGVHFNQHVSAALLQGVSKPRRRPRALDDPYDLTQREMEVLQLICEEYTTPEIAEKLHLSTYTVEGYRKNIIQKTGVKNAAGLVALAFRMKWIQ